MNTIFKKANENLRSGFIDEAIFGFDQAIHGNPSCFYYYQNAAYAYAQKKNFIEASSYARLAASYAPHLSSLRALLNKYNNYQTQEYATPSLSIIVPVFNTKHYLSNCIESITSQTFKDFELIIIDDGSTDGSSEIIERYAANDNRIVTITNKKPSGNPGTPRNQALRIARGSYIGFVDSDDWIDPDFYSCLMEKALSESSDIVFSGGFKNHYGPTCSTRKYDNSNFNNATHKFYKYHDSFMIWDKVFKKEVLERFSIALGETKAAVDVPFIFKSYFYSHAISYCNDLIGYNYRRETPSSVTLNQRRKSSCSFELLAYENIQKWANQNGIPSYFNDIINIKKITSYAYTLDLINENDFESFFSRVKRELKTIDRQLVASFAKELKKNWVLKKFDAILGSTPAEYFNSTRQQEVKKTSSAKSKMYIEGAKPGILFFPAWLQANPYQELFYRAVNTSHKLRIAGYAKEDLCNQLLESLREKFSYIHFHWLHTFISGSNIETDNFISTIRYAKSLGYKIIYTAHNIISHESADIEQEVKIRKKLIKEFDIIIAHGKAAEQLLIHELDAKPNQISIMPHGTYGNYYPKSLTQVAAREKLGIPENSFVYLFFGNIRNYKGVDPLIDEFEKLQSTAPKAKLLICGRPLNTEVEQRIKDRSAVNTSILFHSKFVDNDEVQIYLNASNAFVLPYQKVLTSGAALLALTFKKPVIAPRLGVLPEYINKSVGELFGSYEEMGSLMEKWYGLWSLGLWDTHYQESAFESFFDSHSWNNLVRNIAF